MRLIIIPFDEQFSKPLEDEIVEIETDSKEIISKKLFSLKEGSNYNIEIYKNLFNHCFFQASANSTGVFLTQNNKTNSILINDAPYDTLIRLIKLYISENGTEELSDSIDEKIAKNKSEEIKKYKEWKSGFDKKQQSKNKLHILKNISIVTIILLSSFFLFNFFAGYEFSVRSIIKTKAIVTGTHDFLFKNETCNKQKIYYDYIVGDRKFSRKEYKRCHKVKIKEGDSILIKYHKQKPALSSIIGK